MHFGFWNEHTKNRQEAILNENETVITYGSIKKNMKILDAGCGVGGTAMYIADQTGATVYGVTLDPEQVKLATSYAKKRNLEDLVKITSQDYTNTNFPDNYFDVIYGIESICHASPKTAFFKEAFRLLKPNGKLIILDAYISRELRTKLEISVINDFKHAFALEEFITTSSLTSQLKKTGFTSISQTDQLNAVIPTIRFFSTLTSVTKFFCLIAKHIPNRYIQSMYTNYLAMISTKKAFDMGIFTYQIHTAIKPKR